MAEMVNVAVDAMGGDNAPVETVKGAVEAINQDKRVKVYLLGQEAVIKEELQKYTYDASQVPSFTSCIPFTIEESFFLRIALTGGSAVSITSCACTISSCDAS